MSRIAVAILPAFLGAFVPAARAVDSTAEPLSVIRSALCTAVKDREPVDPAPKPEPTLNASLGQVYFWTEVRGGADSSTSIRHVWYKGDEKVAAVTLAVRGVRTRTWSRTPVWPGKWRVQAVDAAGTVLAEAAFLVAP